ncbi:nucleoside/nucleotide kinase family protein [Aliiroseovarius sp. F47248L]|uniref:nucleoside/nucleotide kinase family protein n=1 Tax=Aliiroseovarius sp. F47248L TaxID=2926420 RepID=UPI001FF673FB|nr:nucleoside/nucleotide kinase family protein [Aliiroseovarius sp. F47248L]
MSNVTNLAATLLDRILAAPRAGQRRLVALAGPPASGKSTLSSVLADQMKAAGCNTLVVPMDGFHLDNRILSARGLLPRKGAPETFDVEGFKRLVAALPHSDLVYFPIFDRDRDIAIAGAGVVPETCDTIIIEGNYLLFHAPGWRDLGRFWDISVRLDVPEDVLKKRLVDRWLAHGLTPDQARARAAENDLPNANSVSLSSLNADITVTA